MSAELDAKIDRLRRELLRRLDAHPFETWSPELLTAVIGVLDLNAPAFPAAAKLRVVKGSAR